MAFNLKKVLKALLLSSNQPLAIKDIQGVFTRFHEQAGLPAVVEETDESAKPADGAVLPAELAAMEAAIPASAETTAAGVLAEEPTEIVVESPESQDAELYGEVPSLVTTTQIREAMDVIAAEMCTADDGLILIEGNSGYRLVTQPRFARWVRILRAEPPPVKLSQSAIETLAVISYRQPVTRGEIETIRGVSAEAGLNKLLERELVYITGRADSPGRPIQYGTTDQFLEFLGIKSLDELPASDVLSSRQIDDWLKTSGNSHTPTDTDMGLANEELPLEAPVEMNATTPTMVEEAAPEKPVTDAGETPVQS